MDHLPAARTPWHRPKNNDKSDRTKRILLQIYNISVIIIGRDIKLCAKVKMSRETKML